MYCQYYHAHTFRPKTWFVIGSLRNEDNLAFARTFDKKNSIIELFVPKNNEEKFLSFMQYLQENGYVLKLEKKENRLKD